MVFNSGSQMKKTVLVAMSGGVDSSITAALLKEQGYRVIGITMQLLPREINNKATVGCCGIENIEDARYVASLLKIPHYVINFRELFTEKVINNFIQEYRSGRTPNPCIKCNQYIKFKYLILKAEQIGADFISTGHYARIQYSSEKGVYLLKKGIDQERDQSYFLYVMTQSQLARTLMPLGEYTKAEVRNLARNLKLPVHEKPDSQEICFVTDRDYRRFLESFCPQAQAPGPILNKQGRVIGQHEGITNFTIGQRRGLGISSSQPLYVTRIDSQNNSITVGAREEVMHRELLVSKVIWTSGPVTLPMRVKIKIRSIHIPADALIEYAEDEMVRGIFDEPQWAVTPGQAAVFYDKDVVVGGGTIEAGR